MAIISARVDDTTKLEAEKITFDKTELEELVVKAIQNSANSSDCLPSAYLGPNELDIRHTD